MTPEEFIELRRSHAELKKSGVSLDKKLQEHVTAAEKRHAHLTLGLNDVKTDMAVLRIDLHHNTQETKSVKENTAELVDVFKNVKGGFAVLEWVGRMAKPIGVVLGILVIGWQAVKAYLGIGIFK